MTTNDDTSNTKNQPCNTFSQGKVRLYALFRSGRKYIGKKSQHFFDPKGAEVIIMNYGIDIDHIEKAIFTYVCTISKGVWKILPNGKVEKFFYSIFIL